MGKSVGEIRDDGVNKGIAKVLSWCGLGSGLTRDIEVAEIMCDEFNGVPQLDACEGLRVERCEDFHVMYKVEF